MKRLTVKRRWVLPAALVFLLICLAVSLYRSRNSLSCSAYTLEVPELTAPVRLLQLSDLHNRSFGPGNEDLLALAADQAPDLILLTGDLVSAGEPDMAVAAELIRELSVFAPVYVSLGNHEWAYREHYGVDPAEIYREAGATVLDFRYLDLTVAGQELRLGGIYGYCLPEKYLSTGEARREECDFMKVFQDTRRYTVLMSHLPIVWLVNGGLEEWDVDCVLSGHLHGGQIVLPFAGGVYAPDLGWFPGRAEGLYTSADGSRTLVLSRGLGTAAGTPPRFNNLPELVVVDLVPAKD